VLRGLSSFEISLLPGSCGAHDRMLPIGVQELSRAFDQGVELDGTPFTSPALGAAAQTETDAGRRRAREPSSSSAGPGQVGSRRRRVEGRQGSERGSKRVRTGRKTGSRRLDTTGPSAAVVAPPNKGVQNGIPYSIFLPNEGWPDVEVEEEDGEKKGAETRTIRATRTNRVGAAGKEAVMEEEAASAALAGGIGRRVGDREAGDGRQDLGNKGAAQMLAGVRMARRTRTPAPADGCASSRAHSSGGGKSLDRTHDEPGPASAADESRGDDSVACKLPAKDHGSLCKSYHRLLTQAGEAMPKSVYVSEPDSGQDDGD